MKTSEQVNEVFAALAKAQGQVQTAIKDKENPFHKNKYASLDSIWDSCRDALSKNGLAITQWPSVNGDHLTMGQMLTHSSGQYIEYDLLEIKLDKISAQGIGSAITYARRYMLSAAIGITADEDDDANIVSTPASDKNEKSPKPDNRPWQQQNPVFEKFLAMARKKFGIEDEDIKEELKAAGFSVYTKSDAPKMWQALEEAQKVIEAEEAAIVSTLVPDGSGLDLPDTDDS